LEARGVASPNKSIKLTPGGAIYPSVIPKGECMESPYRAPEAELSENQISYTKYSNHILFISILLMAIRFQFAVNDFKNAGPTFSFYIALLGVLIPFILTRTIYFGLLIAKYPFTPGWVERNAYIMKYVMSVFLICCFVLTFIYDITKI
jgi:hypothetical protein